jgi:hypothetical protein
MGLSSEIDIDKFGGLPAEKDDCPRQNSPPKPSDPTGPEALKPCRQFIAAAFKKFANGFKYIQGFHGLSKNQTTEKAHGSG